MKGTLNQSRIVYYTVLESEGLGDMERCATVEVAPDVSGWTVSVSPTRAWGQRGMSLWVDDRGERRVYKTAHDAMAAVQKERPGVLLRWGQKMRLTPPVAGI